jgi:hypothetical protein
VASKAKDSGRLTVARLTVRNVLGVEDHVIDLDTITVLQGANATGKSSHLKALRSALGIDRTALARLARLSDTPGEAEDPTVEVLLVGDGREVQVTRKGSGSPEVKERIGEDWRKVARPVEWLRDLIDVSAANPAAWLAADDETRATMLLEAMPLEGYSRAAALKAAGLEGFTLPAIPAGLHPLEDLEQIEAAVFSSRTVVNGQQRDEHNAAQKLLAGLPAEAPKDAAAEVALLDRATSARAAELAAEQARVADALEAATRDAETHLDLAGAKVKGDFRTEAQKLRTAHEAQAAEIRAEAERQVSALAARVEQDVDALRAKGEREIAAAESVADAAVATAQQTHAVALKALDAHRAALATDRERLAALRGQQQSVATDTHVRTTAAQGEARARQHEAKAQALTASLEALKRYRLELAERLPIKGLAVHFDEKGRKSLTLDGVPLSQVNDGRLAELATEVSLLRSRPPEDGRPYLPLILLDGIERLDKARRAAVLRSVAARGAQVVAAVVGDGALRTLRGEEALKGEAA